MQKLYAKLCQELKEHGYEGIETKYADTVVDNGNGTIEVEFNIVNFVNSVHIEGDKIVINDE